MERGDHFSCFQQHANSNAGQGMAQHNDHRSNPVNNAGANANINATAAAAAMAVPPPPCMVREQDQYMPIANVIRIMRRILPAHAKISDDAKETIQECVSEYISFITGEANERCQKEQRKTITAEDVLWAMAKLGFDDYIEPLSLFLARYRESEGDRGSLLRGDPFRPTSFQMIGGHSINPQGVFDPSMLGGSGPGLYRDGSGTAGGSSSQPEMPVFDPFAEFK